MCYWGWTMRLISKAVLIGQSQSLILWAIIYFKMGMVMDKDSKGCHALPFVTRILTDIKIYQKKLLIFSNTQLRKYEMETYFLELKELCFKSI